MSSYYPPGHAGYYNYNNNFRPQGPPPPYRYTRVYRNNLRPIVLISTILAGLWALLWAIGSFKDISIDRQNAPRLLPLDIVLGVLYLIIFIIALFGFAASLTESPRSLRLYAYGMAFATLVVFVTALLRVIVHFAYKNTLINECIALATGQTVEVVFGIWGSISETQLTQPEASSYCNSEWSHDSFNEIVWLIIALIGGLLFTMFAFQYYRRMNDPSSPDNRISGPGVPNAYQKPYPQQEYAYGNDRSGGSGSNFAPPPGAPPDNVKSDSTSLPPAYSAEGYLPHEGQNKGPGSSVQGSRYGQNQRPVVKDPFADSNV